jgi:YjbE family integral membrane protein
LFDISVAEFSAFLSVIWIDLVLAGDNAIIVGTVAASVPKDQRIKVLVIGIVAATIMRIGFALITTQLLAIIGLMLAGGVLLLWVCWKLWRDIEAERRERRLAKAATDAAAAANGTPVEAAHAPEPMQAKSFAKAVFQIVVADVTMSLDNVLAVAGTAHEHPRVLIFGLALSVALMAVASGFVAWLLKKYPWIAYIGLAVIVIVACRMIFDGAMDVMDRTSIGEFVTP